MHKGSILVIDDESEIREGLELLLTSEGYGVTSAGTGESGLARLEERPFDLLLLDVTLPDRNGLDLLKEVRRRDPGLSVVLITAYSKAAPWITLPSPGPTTSSSRKSRKPWNPTGYAKRTCNSSAPSSSASVSPALSARAKRCSRCSISSRKSRRRAPPC